MNIAILGAGAWGTAMAIHLQRSGNRVTLVSRRVEHALAMASERENRDYLPGYRLSNDLQIACELLPVLMEAELVILACPSSGLRALCEQVKSFHFAAKRIRMVVTLSKGFEKGTLESPSQVLDDVLPDLPHGVLSGPSNAAEVAAGKPTAIVFASELYGEAIKDIQEAISGSSLRVYSSRDVKGVLLGGCLKNIYAIGAGVCDGIALGDNAKSAYMTRALHEMAKFGVLLGGKMETFYGLSGMGDLIATCSGNWSRNRTFGQEIAKGKTVQSLLENRKTVVEGFWATECFHDIAQKHKAYVPILEQVYRILYQGLNPAEAITELMMRDLRTEV